MEVAFTISQTKLCDTPRLLKPSQLNSQFISKNFIPVGVQKSSHIDKLRSYRIKNVLDIEQENKSSLLVGTDFFVFFCF